LDEAAERTRRESELAVYNKRCYNQAEAFISNKSLICHRMDY